MRLAAQTSKAPQRASVRTEPIFPKQHDQARSEFALSTPGDIYEREADRVAADVLREPGQPLDAAARAFVEPRFGHDFGRVRVHVGDRAEESAAALHARAYTLGNRIVFGAGQYAPATASGRMLIAHELTHVLQQGNTPHPMRPLEPAAPAEDELDRHPEGMEVGGDVGETPVRVRERGDERVSRDLAVEPTRPDAPEPVLTAQQIQQAIRYNAFRFKDPYSIAVVRDLVGVPRFPAVSDEDLARGVARYQAAFDLTPDGQAGPDTTRRLVREARAEDLPRDANQLRADNYVLWAPAAGTHNGCGAVADAAGHATFFQWDVNFSTSLRNGWIVPGDRQWADQDHVRWWSDRRDADPPLLGGVVGRRGRQPARRDGDQCRAHPGHCQRRAGVRARSLAPCARCSEQGELEHDRSTLHQPAPPRWFCSR
jgi:hypothetical protein